MQKLGIAKLKVLFAGILNLATTVSAALKDGAQFEDLFVIVKQWPNVNLILQEAHAGWLELKDLDSIEAQELADFIALEFDIPNDQVEARIETGVRLVAKWYHQVEGATILFEETKDWVGTLKQAA
ncbi:MAG: hypothetical protein HUU01_00535 [Saprospiraceae bacterium]|nr:hypothetical protein [Saprospiraceae bacterium]